MSGSCTERLPITVHGAMVDPLKCDRWLRHDRSGLVLNFKWLLKQLVGLSKMVNENENFSGLLKILQQAILGV